MILERPWRWGEDHPSSDGHQTPGPLGGGEAQPPWGSGQHLPRPPAAGLHTSAQKGPGSLQLQWAPKRRLVPRGAGGGAGTGPTPVIVQMASLSTARPLSPSSPPREAAEGQANPAKSGHSHGHEDGAHTSGQSHFTPVSGTTRPPRLSFSLSLSLWASVLLTRPLSTC